MFAPFPQQPYTLSDPMVTAFYEQPDGDLWIGTGWYEPDEQAYRQVERFPFPRACSGEKNMIYAIQPVSPSGGNCGWVPPWA